MSGSSYDRRKALRAKERLSKRAMSEGRYPWLESVLAQPEKPAEAEKAISAASAFRSGGKPLKEVIPDTPKDIAPPEPRGEAEGVLVDISYLEQSILNDSLWTRAKDPMWIQAFKEHGRYGKPAGCRPCYAKVLQWYKAGKPERPKFGVVDKATSELDKVTASLKTLKVKKKRPILWRIWRGLRKLVGR